MHGVMKALHHIFTNAIFPLLRHTVSQVILLGEVFILHFLAAPSMYIFPAWLARSLLNVVAVHFPPPSRDIVCDVRCAPRRNQL